MRPISALNLRTKGWTVHGMAKQQRTSAHHAEEDPRNENVLCFVNGEGVPRQEAKVSIFDSGFMLGDGVWEGIRLHNGVWAFLEDHLDRLFGESRALHPELGMPRSAWIAAIG